MAVSREDQNTFFLIGAILIVCLIAIIAIFSGVWALLREPVERIGNEIGEFVRVTRIYDYNFAIPQVSAEAPVQEETSNNNSDGNYNFQTGNKSYEGAILSQDELIRKDRGEDIHSADLNIEIPKIAVNSKILQGNNSSELLKQGFWVAPISNTLGKGQILLFCERTYFGQNDPRSCWFINTLEQGDDIIIKVNDEEVKYKVLSSDIVEADNELIYQLNPNNDLIKIVTFTPRETGEKRLEIIAIRVQ